MSSPPRFEIERYPRAKKEDYYIVQLKDGVDRAKWLHGHTYVPTDHLHKYQNDWFLNAFVTSTNLSMPFNLGTE
jgi:hypothetical protein